MALASSHAALPFDAETQVRELAHTAAKRLRPTTSESLLDLAELMRSGDPADVLAAGDLWHAEARRLGPPLDGLSLGDSWQSEDALHAKLCREAAKAVVRWFEEMTALAEAG